ncbi:unnamed protein product [Adineta steineri]|uniref:Uncharacterized protein n=1 Tax=Adineta steineri TaxID=433720 RepID=A0A813N758_9BILA|nr:unnamed protein product [Adineta steineri]
MARKYQEIDKEIRRIEGQLLVAKQICRENVKEINHLKSQQKNDSILQQINDLLSIKSLNSDEHADQFNRLLHLVYEQQTVSLDNTIQYDEQEKKNEQCNSLLVNLSLNIAELESIFDNAKTLFTQPITSVNMFNNNTSLQEIADDQLSDTYIKERDPIQIYDLQKRVEILSKRLADTDQCDDCLIQ